MKYQFSWLIYRQYSKYWSAASDKTNHRFWVKLRFIENRNIPTVQFVSNAAFLVSSSPRFLLSLHFLSPRFLLSLFPPLSSFPLLLVSSSSLCSSMFPSSLLFFEDSSFSCWWKTTAGDSEHLVFVITVENIPCEILNVPLNDSRRILMQQSPILIILVIILISKDVQRDKNAVNIIILHQTCSEHEKFKMYQFTNFTNSQDEVLIHTRANAQNVI